MWCCCGRAGACSPHVINYNLNQLLKRRCENMLLCVERERCGVLWPATEECFADSVGDSCRQGLCAAPVSLSLLGSSVANSINLLLTCSLKTCSDVVSRFLLRLQGGQPASQRSVEQGMQQTSHTRKNTTI